MNPPGTDPAGHRAPRSATGEGAGLPVIPSSALLRGHSAVVIEHQGQHYRLQATKQGKLILTK